MIAPAVLDAEFSLACIAIQDGKPHDAVIKGVLDHWGVIEKQRGSSGGPGDHGIPEIGRLEAKFYNELTFSQREAFDALRQLVDQLYAEGRGTWAGLDPWKIDEPIDEWKHRAIAALSAHPMQAFLLGQMLASQVLRAPMPRPLAGEDRRAIDFLNHYTFNEISSKFDELKGTLRNHLVAGVEQGLGPREVARQMANALHDYNTDWELIAITETSRAESQGRLQEFKDAGVEYVIGSSAHDSKTCDHCLRLINNVVVPVAETISQSNYGLKQAQWKSVIPLHPRCRCVWLPYRRTEKALSLEPITIRPEHASGEWTVMRPVMKGDLPQNKTLHQCAWCEEGHVVAQGYIPNWGYANACEQHKQRLRSASEAGSYAYVPGGLPDSFEMNRSAAHAWWMYDVHKFEESEHPRDDEGRFTSAGGASAADRRLWEIVKWRAADAKKRPDRYDAEQVKMFERLLSEGRFHRPRPLERKPMEAKQCFHNAYRLAEDEKLPYTEGLAWDGAKAVHHAWSHDEHGNVIDPTWYFFSSPEAQKQIGYFGIDVPDAERYKAAFRRKKYGVFVED